MDQKTTRMQNVNIDRLKILKKLDINEDITSGKLDEDEFYVEQILDHRIVGKSTQYLIRWKDYDEDADTWEYVKNLDCADKLNEYWETKNGANQINCFAQQRRFEPSEGGNVVDIEETFKYCDN